MNWTRIEANWDQMKGQLRSKWGKLSDDDVEMIAGKKDRLVGVLKEKYGMAREEIESTIDSWTESLDDRQKA